MVIWDACNFCSVIVTFLCGAWDWWLVCSFEICELVCVLNMSREPNLFIFRWKLLLISLQVWTYVSRKIIIEMAITPGILLRHHYTFKFTPLYFSCLLSQSWQFLKLYLTVCSVSCPQYELIVYLFQGPPQPGQPIKFTVGESCDRIKEEFNFLQAQYHK